MTTTRCPGCAVLVRLSDEAVAASPVCPRCKSPLVLTVDAPAKPKQEVPNPPQVKTWEPEPVPEPRKTVRRDEEEDGDDDADLFLRRMKLARRKKAKQRLVITAAVTITLLVTAAVAVAAFASRVRDMAGKAKNNASAKKVEPAVIPEPPPPQPVVTRPDPRPQPQPVQNVTPPQPAPFGHDDRPTAIDTKIGGSNAPFPFEPPVRDVPPMQPKQPIEEYKSDKPAREVFSGYYQRTVSGFTLYVSRMAYERSDENRGRPLKVVTDEVERLAELFPESSLKAMRKLPVWVEWDHTIPRSVNAFAVFYGKGGHDLLTDGVDPRKSGCVCVLSLKVADDLKTRGAKQNTLLHEFAHAIHFYAFGFDNASIANAYAQASARRLYDNIRHDDGRTRPAYAGQSRAEYFAELTCAYLDKLDYPPHDAKELRDHDSVGYEMMAKCYGTPEQIAKMRHERDPKPKPKTPPRPPVPVTAPTEITPKSP